MDSMFSNAWSSVNKARHLLLLEISLTSWYLCIFTGSNATYVLFASTQTNTSVLEIINIIVLFYSFVI